VAKGKQAAEQAFKFNPNAIPALSRMGLAAYREDDYRQALKYFQEAHARATGPLPNGALCAEAMAYAKLGETQSARRLFQKALETLEQNKGYIANRQYHNAFVAEALEVLRQ
jgi:Flp pilus assembly protein TadD